MQSAIDEYFFSDLGSPSIFYLVRHGESVANAERRIQGHSDYHLNDQGRNQARSAGSWFSDKKVSQVFCSPLVRAHETARIIAAGAGLPEPIPYGPLIEVNVGKFSGLTLEEAKQRFPVDYERFMYQSWEGVSDAERCASIAARARTVWAMLKDSAIKNGGNVLAVTHGGLLQWLVRVTFGCTSWMPLLTTGNCGVFELSVMPTKPGKPAYIHWKEINLIPDDGTNRIEPVF